MFPASIEQFGRCMIGDWDWQRPKRQNTSGAGAMIALTARRNSVMLNLPARAFLISTCVLYTPFTKRIQRREDCPHFILNFSSTPLMDILWTPWRFAYITTADTTLRPGVPAALAAWPGDLGCVFCNLIASIDYAIARGMSRDEAEAAGGLIQRGKNCFVCLNAYPYTSGHVMVMPYAHLDRLAILPIETAHELIETAQQTERVLQKLYRPHGLNFGMNLGQAAGAGVAGHLHLHALPRWAGDTNFMTTVAETRVLPEDLPTTWKRMRLAFAELNA